MTLTQNKPYYLKNNAQDYAKEKKLVTHKSKTQTYLTTKTNTTMKKHLKNLVAIIMAVALAVGFTSCSNDDDYNYDSTGYYMTSRAWGGGLTTSERDELVETVNDALDAEVNTYLKYYNRTEAINYFEIFVVEYQQLLKNGIPGVSGTLTLVFELRSLGGGKVRSQSLHITSHSCKLV